jgi:DNA-binding response OmpR family regulator
MDKLSALLVDDEEELVSTLGERLELRGIDTQIATDGESALEIMKTNPPQVVVLDVMMPGMGGIQILEQMKLLNIRIPVLLLTGYGSKNKGLEGVEMGAYDYLMKPMNIDELIAKMHEAVGSNKSES